MKVAEPPGPTARSRAKRWLREPLLHFVLIGLALFVGYGALNPEAERRENSSRIEITRDDVRQLEVAWMAQWRRHPTAEEMRALIDGKVREEILYREALALGLDKDDTIVKRRLAQKMAFLAEDVSTVRDPGREELRAWFEKNRERFALPGLVSFRHLYFSPDSRGERAREMAARELERVAGRPADIAVHGSAIGSCSRTTTVTAGSRRWQACSASNSRRRCSASSPVRGRDRSSPGWAGTWSSSPR